MKPSRKEIEDAIKTATIRTEDIPDTSGISFEVGKLRMLVKAARWALELIDNDNPPALPEDLTMMKRRAPPPARRKTRR